MRAVKKNSIFRRCEQGEEPGNEANIPSLLRLLKQVKAHLQFAHSDGDGSCRGEPTDHWNWNEVDQETCRRDTYKKCLCMLYMLDQPTHTPRLWATQASTAKESPCSLSLWITQWAQSSYSQVTCSSSRPHTQTLLQSTHTYINIAQASQKIQLGLKRRAEHELVRPRRPQLTRHSRLWTITQATKHTPHIFLHLSSLNYFHGLYGTHF